MATYSALLDFTDQGIRNLRETAFGRSELQCMLGRSPDHDRPTAETKPAGDRVLDRLRHRRLKSPHPSVIVPAKDVLR